MHEHQPEALRLADELDALVRSFGRNNTESESATELRRLHQHTALLEKRIDNVCDLSGYDVVTMENQWTRLVNERDNLRAQVERLQAAQGQVSCNSDECGWTGPVSETCMLGAVGPLCPKCRETTEPAPVAAAPALVPLTDEQIAAWAQRHDVKGSMVELRCIAEDAVSLGINGLTVGGGGAHD